MCAHIAAGILSDERDREECLNDAYLNLWNAIPPACPTSLRAYLFTTVRHSALILYRKYTAEKRKGERSPLEIITELASDYTLTDTADTVILQDALNRFLSSLPASQRIIFVRRYYYGLTVEQIAGYSAVSCSKVKLTLLRTRTALKEFLKKEDFIHEEL